MAYVQTPLGGRNIVTDQEKLNFQAQQSNMDRGIRAQEHAIEAAMRRQAVEEQKRQYEQRRGDKLSSQQRRDELGFAELDFSKQKYYADEERRQAAEAIQQQMLGRLPEEAQQAWMLGDKGYFGRQQEMQQREALAEQERTQRSRDSFMQTANVLLSSADPRVKQRGAAMIAQLQSSPDGVPEMDAGMDLPLELLGGSPEEELKYEVDEYVKGSPKIERALGEVDDVISEVEEKDISGDKAIGSVLDKASAVYYTMLSQGSSKRAATDLYEKTLRSLLTKDLPSKVKDQIKLELGTYSGPLVRVSSPTPISGDLKASEAYMSDFAGIEPLQ